MFTSRNQTLLQFLRAAFQNEDTKKQWLATNNTVIAWSQSPSTQEGNLGRLFDNVPSTLPGYLLQDLSTSLVSIIANIKGCKKTDDGFILTDEADTRKIREWAKPIFNWCLPQLVDKQNRLSSEFVNLLEWTFSPPPPTHIVLSAYVGASIHQVTKIAFHLIMNATNQQSTLDTPAFDNYHAVTHYLTHHYCQWVDEQLRLNVKQTKKTADIKPSNPVHEFVTEYPGPSILLGLAFFGVAGAAATAIYVASSGSSKSKGR